MKKLKINKLNDLHVLVTVIFILMKNSFLLKKYIYLYKYIMFWIKTCNFSTISYNQIKNLLLYMFDTRYHYYNYFWCKSFFWIRWFTNVYKTMRINIVNTINYLHSIGVSYSFFSLFFLGLYIKHWQ